MVRSCHGWGHLGASAACGSDCEHARVGVEVPGWSMSSVGRAAAVLQCCNHARALRARRAGVMLEAPASYTAFGPWFSDCKSFTLVGEISKSTSLTYAFKFEILIH